MSERSFSSLFLSSALAVKLTLNLAGAKGPTKNNFPFWDADPSRLAALLEAQISRYSSLLAPCQTGAPPRRLVRDYQNASCRGASAPEKGNLFLAGPLARFLLAYDRGQRALPELAAGFDSFTEGFETHD